MMKLLSQTTLYIALGLSSAIASAQSTLINTQCTPSGFYQNDSECFIKVRPRRRGEEETNGTHSVWALNVTQSGDFCYRTLDKVTLWRPDASESAQLSIKEANSQQELVAVPFRRKVNEQPWPYQIIDQAGTYQMRLSDGESVIITLKAIPSYETDETAWMQNNGCTQQAARYQPENQMAQVFWSL
jgi:hypothetical protein